MATSVVEKLLVNIEANAAQLQAELAKGGAAVQTFGRQTGGIAKGADGIGERYSRAAITVASAAESMARSGNVAGAGLKQIIVQGSNMAFLFGAQGAVVGAVGIASLAIIEVFRKARDETRKLAEETKRALDEMQNRGDVAGLTDRARVLFEGTPSAGFADGIKAMRKEYEALGRTLDALKNKGGVRAAQLAQFGTAGAAAAKVGSSGAGALGNEFAKVKQKYDALAAQLRAAEAEFREIQRKVQAPGPSATRTPDPIRTTVAPLPNAADAKRSADEATREAAAMRDLTQAFDDLFAKAREGDLSLADFDRTMRELGDGFRDKIKTPTEAQSAAFETLIAKAGGVREALQAIQASRAAAELRKIEAALTPSVIDDMAIAMQALRDRLAELKAPPEVVERVVALQAALDDATVSGAQLDEILAGIASSGAGPLPQMLALGEQRRAKEAEIFGITEKSEAADRRRATLKAQIVEIQAAEAKLAADQAVAGARSVEHAKQQLTVVQDIASAAFGVATAFLGADATLVKMIGSAVQVASSLARIGELAEQAGGLSSLFSTGGGIASALPAIGGIIGGVAGLASLFKRGESSAERAQRQLLEQNNQRLKELRDTLARQVGQSISGQDRATLEAVYRLPFVRQEPGRPDEYTGEPTVTEVPKSAKELLAELNALGFGMDKLRAAAKAAGITLSANPTVEELAQLGNVLGTLDFEAFAHSFAGAMAQLDAEFTLFPQKFRTNVERFQAVVAALNDSKTGAPALFKGLEGLDTSTAEGKQAALAEIQRLFDLYRDGKLTSEDLKGLSLDEFFETLKRLKSELGDLPEERTAAERFAKALEAFGTAVELGSMSAEEKLAKARDLFASLFPDLAASVDTSSAEAFKQSIQSIIDGFAADGELTEAEQAQIAVLRLLIETFDGVTTAADDAARATEEAMLAARALVFSLADAVIAVHDITDPIEILKVRAAALAQAFPELADVMAQFDLATEEGRAALEAWIQSLVDSPEALKAMADGLGISIDDLLGRLLALESAADDAAAAVETLATKLGAAFDSADFAIELEGITDPLEKLKRTSAAIGDVLPDIADIFKQFDVASEEGRGGAEAALIALAKSTDDAAVRSAVLKLLGQIRGVKGDETAPGAGLGGGGGGGGRTGVAATASITEVTGNRLVDLFGRNVVATEQIRDSLAAALGRTLAVPGSISPPALPSWMAPGGAPPSGSGGSGAVVLQLTLPQIVFNGPVTTASEAELARLIQSRFMDLIQTQLAREFRVALRRAGVARSN